MEDSSGATTKLVGIIRNGNNYFNNNRDYYYCGFYSL